jgi:recombination DNA repair RAD52 pathway protein
MNDQLRFYEAMSTTKGKAMDNLKLWDAVQSTDPQYTKQYKGAGGFSGTAINATYVVKRLTEAFGKVGTGWGYEILEERFDEGGPIDDGKGNVICNSSLHTVKLRLWYKDGDEIRHVDHYGHTPYISKNKYGVQTEMEPVKKSVTDALKKAASMLGFGADIHLGMFDDIEYVQEAQNESLLAKAEDKAEEARRQQAEYDEFLEKHVSYIETSRSMGELEKIFTAAVRRAQSKKDERGIIRLTKAKDAKKAELSKGDQQ